MNAEGGNDILRKFFGERGNARKIFGTSGVQQNFRLCGNGKCIIFCRVFRQVCVRIRESVEKSFSQF